MSHTDLLPPVAWSIAGKRVSMAPGWSATCTAGGHDQMRGTVPLEQWRSVPDGGQGSIVRGVAGDGTVVWEGRLSQPPQIISGEARVAAQGHKYRAEKKTDRLFIQSRDMSIWQSLDGEPFLNANGVPFYAIHRKIDTAPGNRLKWSIPLNDQLLSGSRDGFAFWAEGVNLSRIKFVMSYGAADETTDWAIEVRKANGPTGADTAETSYNTTTANNGATKDYTLSATRDMVLLCLLANVNHTATSTRAYRVSRIWVNSDITTGDTYYASQVVSYIAGQLGYAYRRIGTDTTLNILPFDWQGGSWLEAMLYVAGLEDMAVRVLHTEGAGPLVEYGAWGTEAWTVTTAGARPEVTPLELFDRVVVFYESPSGQLRRAVIGSGTPYGNTFEYRLEDRQADATLATAVATALYNRLSVQRYAGRIDVATARNARGYSNPYAIRHGDTITIQDWDEAASLRLRVVDVEYRQDGVAVHTEAPNPLTALPRATR